MTHEPPHDAHGHGHHPNLQHHWDSLQQQFEAGKLGMWLFLATEVLFFGGLFVAYAVWRGNNPGLFDWSHHYLDTSMGAINTVVLILSSLTMALGVTYAQLNRKTALVICLWLTVLGGCMFMVIKYFEYTDKFREGIYPGAAFYDPPPDTAKSKYWDPERRIFTQEEIVAMREAERQQAEAEAAARVQPTPQVGERTAIAPPRPAPRGMTIDDEPVVRKYPIHPLQDPNRPENAHMFFNIYFFMTGLHGIHVLVGIGLIGWLALRATKGHFTAEYYTPVDLVGLYWHLVDLIWIFLFPLFYLI